MKKAWIICLVLVAAIGTAWILNQRTTTNPTSSLPASALADYEYVCRCNCVSTWDSAYLCAVPVASDGGCSDLDFDFNRGMECKEEDCKKNEGNACEGYSSFTLTTSSHGKLKNCRCTAVPKKTTANELDVPSEE